MDLRDIRRSFDLLTVRERRQWVIVTILGIFSAMLELLGLSAIIPVVSLLIDFDETVSMEGYSHLYQFLGSPDKSHFLITIAVVAIIINVLSTLIVFLYQFARSRFFKRVNAELATRAFSRYESSSLESIELLSQGEYVRNISAASERLTNMYAGVSAIVARGCLLLLVLVVLMWVNPRITTILISVMVGCYVLIYTIVKPFIKSAFRRNFSDQKAFQKLVLGSYNAKSQVLVYGLSSILVTEFRDLRKRIARRISNIEIAGSAPKFLIETVGVVCLLASALYVGINNGDKTAIIGNLSLFVICAYRALPAIHRIYTTSNMISGSLIIYRELLSGWKQLDTASVIPSDLDNPFAGDCLSLENVSYRYPGTKVPALDSFSCRIPLKGLIRIVGESGAGKTTLIELILGLRMPSSGRVVVGDTSLAVDTVSEWWARTAYVPQAFYLFADTVREAVCAGAAYDEMLFRQALWVSGLDQVLSEKGISPDDYLGNDGVVFSGGERARVALACAFYKEAVLMVFDEAFANLDLDASRMIIRRACETYPQRACLFITHRGAELPDNCVEIQLLEGMQDGN